MVSLSAHFKDTNKLKNGKLLLNDQMDTIKCVFLKYLLYPFLSLIALRKHLKLLVFSVWVQNYQWVNSYSLISVKVVIYSKEDTRACCISKLFKLIFLLYIFPLLLCFTYLLSFSLQLVVKKKTIISNSFSFFLLTEANKRYELNIIPQISLTRVMDRIWNAKLELKKQ